MKLLPNEEMVSTGLSRLLLTNYRIRLVSDEEIRSMFLSQISSVNIGYEENKAYLLYSLAGLAVSIAGYSYFERMLIIMAGVVLIVAGVWYYMQSRHHKFIIVGNGGEKIQFHLRGVGMQTSVEVMEKIEEWKVRSIGRTNVL